MTAVVTIGSGTIQDRLGRFKVNKLSVVVHFGQNSADNVILSRSAAEAKNLAKRLS